MEVKRQDTCTEMAMIPDGWELKTVGEIATVSAGGTPSRTQPRYWNGDIPWATTTEIDFRIITHTAQSITREGLRNSAAKLLPKGTLLMALYGQGKTRGKVAILGLEAATNQACAAISPNANVSSGFLFYSLAGRYGFIRSLSNTGNQENLNGHLVKSIPVPMPSTRAEQYTIATALRDVDELLNGLDQLIAKKRDLKQAAMQQLLTGKVRLPGFTGEWIPHTLGSCGSTYGGLSGKSKRDFGHGRARFVTFMNVLSNPLLDYSTFEAVDVKPGEEQNRVQMGDVLFNGTSETPGDLALGAFVHEDTPNLYLNSFCFGFRFHRGTGHDGLFFAYFFRGPRGRALMSRLAQGATRYNMSKRQFLELEVELPEGDEQREISRVLSDMDASIAALEQRRAKTADLKQAMMQELLTGKTRLVQPEATA